jgi:prophage antirepressor-like protein
MANPQNFCKEAHKLNIRYEFLMEAKQCIGDQSLARLFNGTSMRGGGCSISAGTINNWIETFEYIQKNPNHIDDEQYVVHRLEPKPEYYEYIEILKKSIDEKTIETWKNTSKKKLGDDAQKYGITLGIRNSKAVKNLLERLLKMVERRTENIWSKILKKEDVEEIDYRFTNVPELRRLCKERNLKNSHIKSKEELVKLLKNNQNNIYNSESNDKKTDYNKHNVKNLKKLAKERGLTKYNNLKKDELVKLHQEYDDDIKMIENIDHESIKKSENKNFETISKKEVNKEIAENNNFLKVFKFDDKEIRTIGTSENPWFVAKDICDVLEIKDNRVVLRNIPKKWKGECKIRTLGGNQEMGIINEPAIYKIIMRSNKPNAERFQEYVCEDVLPSIRKTGSYSIDNKYKFILENNRPLSQVINITDMDKEAIQIEKIFNWSKNTNCAIIYAAYIGEGLVKIGFSDSKFDERIAKHISCESKYQQFLVLDTYEVSGKPIEDLIHNLLNKYRHNFGSQKEIYSPPGKLIEFIENIKRILDDNDYKLKYNKLEKENMLLKLEILKLKENAKL